MEYPIGARHAAAVDGLLARPWSFVVGPPKAGTTWIHAYLASHHGAVTPSVKETFFFDRHYHRGWEWYSRQFAASAGDDRAKRFVEVCHDYLFSPSALHRLSHDTSPLAAVVVMRDPVERAVSAYLFHRRNGYSGSLRDALDVHRDIVDHSRYSQWVPEARRILGPGIVRLVDFALLQRDDAAFARSLCEALGLDYVEPSVKDHFRLSASAPRKPAVARTAKLAAITLRRLRGERLLQQIKRVPALQRVLYRPLAEKERDRLVSPHDREYLKRVLAEDVAWYAAHTVAQGR